MILSTEGDFCLESNFATKVSSQIIIILSSYYMLDD